MAHFQSVLEGMDQYGGSESHTSCIMCGCTRPMGLGLELIVCSACGDRFNCCACKVVDRVYEEHRDNWCCALCISELFPFNRITEEGEFIACIGSSDSMSTSVFTDHNCLRLDLFSDPTENRPLLSNVDLDPDDNFFLNRLNISAYCTPSSMSGKFKATQQVFTAMHINCRSISYKIPDIQILLAQLPVKVLAVTETWLDRNNGDSIFIPGYSFTHSSRIGGGGGGVGLFVEKDINFRIFEPQCPCMNSYESLFVGITQKKGADIVVGVIYRPPGENLADFNKEIDMLLLLGDFNVNLLKSQDHFLTNSFLNSMISHHYLPAILRPTRITETTATLIDNDFTNAYSKILDSSILTCDISDHLPVLVWMNFASVPQCYKAPNYARRINDDLIGHFGMILSQMDWSEVSVASEANDPNLAYAIFFDLFKNAYDRVFSLNKLVNGKLMHTGSLG